MAADWAAVKSPGEIGGWEGRGGMGVVGEGQWTTPIEGSRPSVRSQGPDGACFVEFGAVS